MNGPPAPGHSSDEKGHAAAIGVSGILYGVYAWIAFIVCALGALFCALLLPGRERRRRWVTRFARLPFFLAGIPVALNDMHRLPSSPAVVVANHASYLDGVILQAFLPPRYSYVIKGEMQNVPVVSFLLKRIGADHRQRHLPGDGDHRNRVEPRIGDRGDEVGRPRPKCSQTTGGGSGQPTVNLGHEGGPLFVTREYEFDRL